MFQVLEGIIKVIEPKGKAVIGVADGKGLFIWLGGDKILAAFPPKPYVNWQTTRFLLPLDFQVKWKPERNWEEYKGGYTAQNIIPLPNPIPAEFAIEPQLSINRQVYAQPPAQQYITPISGSAVTPNLPTIQPTVANKVMNVADRAMNEALYGLRASEPIDIIAKELTKIRELLELWIKPPTFVDADTLQITQEEVIEEYGIPPDEGIDLDGLPEV